MTIDELLELIKDLRDEINSANAPDMLEGYLNDTAGRVNDRLVQAGIDPIEVVPDRD